MDDAPRTLGKYRIVKELGRGSFGVVYLAEDTTLDNRRVALKVLYPQLVVDPESLGLFHREAGTMAHLDHPHIAAVYEAGDAEERRFIAMRYVPGQTLAQVLHDEGPQPLERVAAWLDQVASALDCAHAQGVLHRDVKPSNILLDRDPLTGTGGRAVVTDFGLAKAVSSSGGSAGSRNREIMSGTARYMAPEQAKGRPVPQSDIYSLGVVVYELLIGQVPFDGDDPFAIAIRHMTEEPRSPRELRPDLPEPVEAVVLRALAKQPADRFVSAGEMASAFRLAVDAATRSQERAAATKQGVILEPRLPEQPAAAQRRAPKMPPWAWAVVGLLVLALVAGVVLIGNDIWGGAAPTPTLGVPTDIAGVTPSPRPGSPSPSQTPSPSSTNTVSPTAMPTNSPKPSAMQTKTPTATSSSTATRSATPTFRVSPSPTMLPAKTPTPTRASTKTPTSKPPSAAFSYTLSYYYLTANAGCLTAQDSTGSQVDSASECSIWEYKASPDSSKAAYWVNEKEITYRRLRGHVAIFIPTQTDWKAVGTIVNTIRAPSTAEFAWNPSGTRLAYHSSHAGLQTDWRGQLVGGNPDLYVADLATRSVIRLTNQSGEDYGATWLDDNRIQYCEEGGTPKYETYVINWDGTGKQKLHDGCAEQR